MIEIGTELEPSQPRDSATVILLREADAGFEVFMVRRHVKSGFMGGAYVFPGGKFDPEDSDPRLIARAGGRDLDAVHTALAEDIEPERAFGLFVAALRETFEEAGVLLATTRDDDVDIAAVRARLEAGESFVELADEHDLTLSLDRISPYTRWVTPVVERRRYDTRFFIAVTPPDQRAQHDERETTASAWLQPTEALARANASEISLPPPTLRTLENLAELGSIAAIVAETKRRPPPLVRPVFRDENGTFVLMLPGDPHHPEDKPALPGPTRFVLADGRWSSGSPKGSSVD